MSKMPKKFAIIGTSCSGKTELFTSLEKELPKKYPDLAIGFVPEAARKYLMSVSISYPPELKHHLAIEQLAYEQEKEISKGKDLVICDRSVLDSVGYVEVFIGKKEASDLLIKITDWLKTYTHFFLLDPQDVVYENDVIRKESQQVRDEVHELYKRYLLELSLPFTLVSGTVEERSKKVLEIIEQKI